MRNMDKESPEDSCLLGESQTTKTRVVRWKNEAAPSPKYALVLAWVLNALLLITLLYAIFNDWGRKPVDPSQGFYCEFAIST